MLSFHINYKKYITTKLSEEIDENPELLSNKIKLISMKVI